MGDDFVTYGFPFVDLRSGGSVEGMIAAMEQVSAQLPADVIGHSRTWPSLNSG